MAGSRFPLLDGWLDTDMRVALRADRTIPLTGREAELVAYLAARPGEAVPRERLLSEVFGYRRGATTRTLDTTVRRIRAKLEPDPHRPQLLQTVHGIGYRWIAPPEPPEASAAGGPTVPVAPRARVPVDPEPILGRGEETDSLLALLDARTPCAVLGPGGTGKSRLARHVGHSWSVASGAPAWWVDAEGVADPDGLAVRIARALSLRLSGVPGAERLGELSRRLAGLDRCLVVLDGVDALLSGTLEALAAIGGEVRLLLTSRSRPGSPWHPFRLRPLGLDDSIELFLTCARARVASFAAPRSEVAEVVSRLDGLPLAVQLAAARVRVLGLGQVGERIARGLDVLRSAGDDREHGALERVLARSWDLLDPDERRALAACTVPVRPFSLANGGALLGAEAEERIEALIDASWLEGTRPAAEVDPGGPAAFSLLATTRQFVLARAAAEPELDAARRQAARRWAAALAEEALARIDPLFGPITIGDAAWLAELSADLEALVDALGEEVPQAVVLAVGFAAQQLGDEVATTRAWERIGGARGRFLASRSSFHPSELRRTWLLEVDAAEDPRLATAAAISRIQLAGSSDEEAFRIGLDAIARFEALGDPMGVAVVCRSLQMRTGQDFVRGAAFRRRGLQAVRAMPDAMIALELLIVPYPLPVEDEPTLDELREAVARARRSGSRSLRARTATALALSALGEGRIDEALFAAEEALQAGEGLEAPAARVGVFGNCGIVLRELGRFEASERCLRKAMDTQPEVRFGVALNLAWGALDRGTLPAAARWIEVAGEGVEHALQAAQLDQLRGVCAVLSGGEGEALWRGTFAPLREAEAHTLLARSMLLVASLGPPDADALLEEAGALAGRYTDTAVLAAVDELRGMRGLPPRSTPAAERPDPGLWLSLVRLVRRIASSIASSIASPGRPRDERA